MAATAYDPTTAWTAAARYTAAAETPVKISNPNVQTRRFVGWTITTSDTIPTIDPSYANPIAPGESDSASPTLAIGERLWLVMMTGFGAGRATIEI
jgi:hypothetical protein